MYKKTFAVESKQVLAQQQQQQQRPAHLVLESVKDTTTHIHLSLNPRITHHELQTLQEKVRQGQKQRRCTSATKLLLSDPSVHVVRPFSCAPRRSHPYGGETVPCSIPTAARRSLRRRRPRILGRRPNARRRHARREHIRGDSSWRSTAFLIGTT